MRVGGTGLCPLLAALAFAGCQYFEEPVGDVSPITPIPGAPPRAAKPPSLAQPQPADTGSPPEASAPGAGAVDAGSAQDVAMGDRDQPEQLEVPGRTAPTAKELEGAIRIRVVGGNGLARSSWFTEISGTRSKLTVTRFSATDDGKVVFKQGPLSAKRAESLLRALEQAHWWALASVSARATDVSEDRVELEIGAATNKFAIDGGCRCSMHRPNLPQKECACPQLVVADAISAAAQEAVRASQTKPTQVNDFKPRGTKGKPVDGTCDVRDGTLVCSTAKGFAGRCYRSSKLVAACYRDPSAPSAGTPVRVKAALPTDSGKLPKKPWQLVLDDGTRCDSAESRLKCGAATVERVFEGPVWVALLRGESRDSVPRRVKAVWR